MTKNEVQKAIDSEVLDALYRSGREIINIWLAERGLPLLGPNLMEDPAFELIRDNDITGLKTTISFLNRMH